MAAKEDAEDRPPPRPSIPRRRREGIVIEATLSNARPQRLRVFAAAALGVVAALALAGVYAARPPSQAFERAAVVAELRQRLGAGEPLAEPLARLERLGVDPAALAPLRPFAAVGAPSPVALAHAGLAKLRKVGETHAAEAEAALERGDIAAALAVLQASPPARAAAQGWMDEAAARLAADRAAEALALKSADGPGDARR